MRKYKFTVKDRLYMAVGDFLSARVCPRGWHPSTYTTDVRTEYGKVQQLPKELIDDHEWFAAWVAGMNEVCQSVSSRQGYVVIGPPMVRVTPLLYQPLSSVMLRFPMEPVREKRCTVCDALVRVIPEEER